VTWGAVAGRPYRQRQLWLHGTKLYSSSKVHFSYETGATFTDCEVSENHFSPLNVDIEPLNPQD
jgi:hypothetical protein